MGTCAFVKADTTTQGSWVGAYGADGYNVIGDALSYPAYATVTPTGNNLFNNGTATNVKDLQMASNHSLRIDAVWFNSASQTIDLALTGGSHQIAAYFYDSGNARAITVQILDQDNGGALLWAKSLSTFGTTPTYFVWNFSGHVAIKIIGNAGINPSIISGFFFDPAGAPATPSGSASFLSSDTTTRGDWVGVYGADGYNVIGDVLSYPAYATVTPSGNTTFNFALPGDNRALQKASSPTTRINSVWFGSAINIDLVLTSGSHQFGIYFFDGDNSGRTESVLVLDGLTGTVYDRRTVSSFYTTPLYLRWNCSGHIVIQVAITGGPNAVISGLFFGGGTPPAAPQQPMICFLA